jgi:EAL domain-containing protein (putative c-di-GMP-specific phosphodiesterase class I)
MGSVPPSTLLFVNLHARDLMDEGLAAPSSPLASIASRVVLEITERASLDEVTDVRGTVTRLREMGFRIAIDDLGAGYAGLTSFAHLEPEFVKLDMTLVRDVHQSAVKQKLVRSMTKLCKDIPDDSSHEPFEMGEVHAKLGDYPGELDSRKASRARPLPGLSPAGADAAAP